MKDILVSENALAVASLSDVVMPQGWILHQNIFSFDESALSMLKNEESKSIDEKKEVQRIIEANLNPNVHQIGGATANPDR